MAENITDTSPALLPVIRNTSRALIVQNNQLLVLEKADPLKGERYALPGGGQHAGESLLDALQRECQEEIDTAVEVAELLQVAECYKNKSNNRLQHQMEFLFRCQVPEGYQPTNGSEPDKHQVGVAWLPLEQVSSARFSPEYLAETILQHLRRDENLYLGSFHDNSPA